MVPPPTQIIEPPPPNASEEVTITPRYYPAVALAIFVWSVTPIAWLIVGLAAWRWHTDTTGTKGFTATAAGWGGAWAILWYYALLELPFSIWLAYLSQRAQKRRPPPKVDHKVLEALLVQCLDVGLAAHPPTKRDGTVSIDAFEKHTVTDEEARAMWNRLRRWFFYADARSIKADNIREWLAWAFGGCELSEARLDKDRTRLVERGLQLVQDRLRWKFPEGYNADIKCMRLTLDPVRTLHRPLGYYLVCNGITNATIRWLKNTHGFELIQEGDCEFLVKRPNPKRAPRPAGQEYLDKPIIFLHGLGIGLGQYYMFLRYLGKHESGVVILKQPGISGDILHPKYLNPPSREEHVRAVKAIVKRFELPPALILGHSNGTMVHGWVSRGAPEICSRHVLVDPVSFRLWEGSVAHAFVVRKWATGLEVLLGYFVARELGTATTIARNFIWSDMALWAHDFPSHKPEDVQFFFGEDDLLLDVPASIAYLRDAGFPAECINVVKGYNHGKNLFIDAHGMTLVRKQCGI